MMSFLWGPSINLFISFSQHPLVEGRFIIFILSPLITGGFTDPRASRISSFFFFFFSFNIYDSKFVIGVGISLVKNFLFFFFGQKNDSFGALLSSLGV